jgi:nucleoside phosphorylase
MEMKQRNSPGQKWTWEDLIERSVTLLDGAERPPVSADPNHGRRKYGPDNPYRKGPNRPHIHVGTIGSANTLLKDEVYRDSLATSHKTIAYEMEGAGVALAAEALSIQYLIVRGICDYADMSKNNEWQRYSSICAAALGKVILQKL